MTSEATHIFHKKLIANFSLTNCLVHSSGFLHVFIKRSINVCVLNFLTTNTLTQYSLNKILINYNYFIFNN